MLHIVQLRLEVTLEVYGKPIGECHRLVADARADGWTTRKHTASGPIYMAGGGLSRLGLTEQLLVSLAYRRRCIFTGSIAGGS